MLRDLLTGLYLLLAGVVLGQVPYPGGDPSVRLYNASRVNTADMEFCPAIYANGLVYVSRFKNGPVNPQTGETFYELFYAEVDPQGLPGKPQSFSMELNSAYHEGPVSFNRTGDRIFFTRTNTQGGVRRADKRGQVGLKIYEARRGLYDWENVTELPFNSDEYSCLHPSLSPDEQRLFFASNMPNGYGGLDLYFVEWQGGGWSQPINLGPEVNTAKNEAFPFLHESGMLFFASDGHPGRGGLDLFMLDMSGRRWGQVLNLGEPFSSPADDLGVVLTPDATRGYFTSNRPGGYGQDDIYLFQAPAGLRGIQVSPTAQAMVTVYDAPSSRLMAGASIRLYELSKDGLLSNQELYDLELVPNEQKQGEMVIQLVRKHEDDLGSPLAVSDRNGIATVPVTVDKDYLLLVSKPGFTTQELRFHAGPNGADRPLEILLSPNNCITLGGTVLSETFNVPVPNALIRITNECNGSVEQLHSDFNGQFEACLEPGCDYLITGSKPGFGPGESRVTTVRLRGSRSLEAVVRLQPQSEAVVREPIAPGTVIVLEDLLYDFNKSSIRKGDSRDLEALARLMLQYPTLSIELSSHTDCRGDNAYNLDLSLRRAESAKEYLVQRGIDGDRIKAIGYGEAYPRNHCVDGVSCTEEQYLYNRRTEAKILSMDERGTTGYMNKGVMLPKGNE